MAKKETIFIYGKHALIEALQNSPKAIEKVFLASDKDTEINELIRKNNIPLSKLSSKDRNIDIEKEASHQGVIAKISLEKLVISFDEFVSDFSPNEKTSIVLLGGLQDPHNVGTIIRSAAAFGVSAVLIPASNQSPITGVVVKTSVGMVFRMPIVIISDIKTAILSLKKKGFKVYGIDGEAKTTVSEEIFREPSLFLFGNESKGIDKNILDLCDTSLKIPMNKRCESLNVAASAAIVLYDWSIKHPEALK